MILKHKKKKKYERLAEVIQQTISLTHVEQILP